jgi:hypothetical protein
MAARHVRSRSRYFGASKYRSSHTERYDSRNDDGSPDAHDSSTAFPEVSGPVALAAGLSAHPSYCEAIPGLIANIMLLGQS